MRKCVWCCGLFRIFVEAFYHASVAAFPLARLRNSGERATCRDFSKSESGGCARWCLFATEPSGYVRLAVRRSSFPTPQSNDAVTTGGR